MQSTSVSLALVALEGVEDYAPRRTSSIGTCLHLGRQLLSSDGGRILISKHEILPVLSEARSTSPGICLFAQAVSIFSSIVVASD